MYRYLYYTIYIKILLDFRYKGVYIKNAKKSVYIVFFEGGVPNRIVIYCIIRLFFYPLGLGEAKVD